MCVWRCMYDIRGVYPPPWVCMCPGIYPSDPELTVSVLPVPDPPQITLAPQNRKVVEDGIVSFFCKASGNPAPDVYWKKEGKRISGNRQRYLVVEMPHGSVLRIEPVKARKDDSEFECVADNGIGEPAIARSTLQVYPAGVGKFYGTM